MRKVDQRNIPALSMIFFLFFLLSFSSSLIVDLIGIEKKEMVDGRDQGEKKDWSVIESDTDYHKKSTQRKRKREKCQNVKMNWWRISNWVFVCVCVCVV